MSGETVNRESKGWPGLAALLPLPVLLYVLASGVFYRTFSATWLETWYFAGLCVMGLAVFLIAGGVRKAAGSAACRLALTGIIVSALFMLYPESHLLSADKSVKLNIPMLAKLLPIVWCVAMWAVAFVTNRDATVAVGTPVAGERLEAFLKRPGVRFQLFVVALLVLPATAALSGVSPQTALWPALLAGALMLALDGILKWIGNPSLALTLSVLVLVACGVAANMGLSDYNRLRAASNQALVHMENGRADAAKLAYDQVVQMSDTLRTNGPRIEMEQAMALQYEKRLNPGFALAHWENVARLTKADPLVFAPILRVRCALGDSLPAWRKLVYEGFPAIDNPDMAPGIRQLAENSPDLRAKLLAALLAWAQKAPAEDRRKALEAVQKLSPGEPSSLNLLQRMGAANINVPLWLPPELIVGSIPTYQSAQGTIEELGEAYTVVCLNAGHWEMSLRAAGTPLHEEWPVVRVELNGQTLSTTQVNKAEEHDVPFTFDVTQSNIFKVRIVFQNHEEDLELGRASRRGLKILGIKFSRAKE